MTSASNPVVPGVVIKFSQANKLKSSEGAETPDDTDNALPVGATEEIELTEDAAAKEFARLYEDRVRFDNDIGRWYVWNGVCWKVDRPHKVIDLVRKHCRKQRGSNKALSTRKAIMSVEGLARSDPRLSVTSDHWDMDPFLLGTPNGAVDLRTGVLHPPKWEDFITRVTKVAPAAVGEKVPLFQTFLGQVTNNNLPLCRFIQQWCGYCLTGVTSEQALVFVYGPGGNGKSVLINVLSEIMGTYAATATMGVLTASKHQRHLTELAMLCGARIVTASETEKDQAWAESRINQLTGGDPVTANFMRQDHFTFIPRFKLTVIGNHKPKLASVNEAARRRFNIVPFLYKPSKKDLALQEKLRKEYPAILRWMIDGCLDWQKDGLSRPAVVTEATEEYFEDQDMIAKWIDECCETGPDKSANATVLFTSWKGYALDHGEYPGTSTTFSGELTQRGYIKTKKSCAWYLGICPKKQPFSIGMSEDQL